MNRYLSVWIIVVLLLQLASCVKKEKNTLNTESIIESDSVIALIKLSRNTNLEDSLRLNLLHKAQSFANSISNDSLRAKYFGLLSYQYFILKDSAKFRHVNKKALEFNKIQKDSIALANAYWDLASFYETFLVKDSAFYAFKEAQNLFEKKDKLLISGRLLVNMSDIQNNVKDYVGSETTITKAIEQLKPLEEYFWLFEAYNKLGIAVGAQGETDKALAYFNEALFYLKQDGNDKIQQARVLNNVGIVFRNTNQYEKAIENFQKVLKIDSLENKNKELYAKAATNLASCKLLIGDTLGAHQLLTESIKYKKETNQMGSLSGSFYTMSQYKAFAKDTLAAIAIAKEAEKLARETDNNERLLETWALLADLQKNNTTTYMKNYVRLNDSLQKEERRQQNKFARIRFETDEFIAENVQLESQRATLSKQKQIWIGIAAGFFLLGLSVYIIINQRAKNQKLLFDQQQQANNQEIFNLMLAQKQKVDEGKRMEQKRISEELHDGVLGKMLGARMVLTGLNKRSTEEAIAEKSKALSSLQEIENEIRSISHELSHNAYQKISNFTDSITSLLSSVRQNIHTVFTYNEDENWDGLPGEVKINVYRIIQETFQNTIKHANCTSFHLTFERTDDLFKVIMEDNGKGFKIEKGKKGIGIRNISSRVKKLNGTWHIESLLNKGTTTTLSIPLQGNLKNVGHTKAQFENVS